MAQGTLYVTDANGVRQALETTVLPDGNSAANQVITDSAGNRVLTDGVSNLSVENGGRSAALNQTVAAAIKASAGRLRRLIIIAPGSSSGAFTLNNCATTGAASAGNTVYSLPYNATANVAGAIFELDIPCDTGITLSAVPGSGSPICVIVYD